MSPGKFYAWSNAVERLSIIEKGICDVTTQRLGVQKGIRSNAVVRLGIWPRKALTATQLEDWVLWSRIRALDATRS